MKKLYTLSFLFLSAICFSQTVVITKVVDGTLASDGCSGASGSSSPKIVEMYVSGTIDFTNYRFQTESNGAIDASAISWNAGFDMTPFGSQTNTFLYLVVGAGTPATAQTFSEMYPALTGSNVIISTGAPNGNGNDAYRIAIYDAPTAGNLVSVVDQFGNPLEIPGGTSDYSAPWAYQDSYASRNNGVGPNAGNFVTSSFTYGGNAAFVAPNNTCAYLISTINLGAYTLGVNQNAIAGLKVYPNPVSNGVVFVETTTNAEKNIVIYDVLGKQVFNTTTADNNINVSALKTGVYVVKITEEGKTATTKLVIK
ncbi:T9SS type A sorting domain-containing protein [Flavobacterium sedimenticola]|uniref:T9SS type A sorting domain-containing protein n=1 Tax=Flavobacterium sedimenticola TaxID=3043286 RepID=A0ABT6XMW8_9FLAO|nr:T9SS type A sorting domain-containing protein [Flavobacterium sedimenticola]MDI9256436.1 T9SS type A sorting domain-containing protein [Flavobacterium sedimenticola]